MFHALAFGEKPSAKCRPMSYRDEDNRGHILASRPASKEAIENQATHGGWDKFVDAPAPSGEKREPQSALLQKRMKARELAEKPQGRPEDQQLTSARRELLKPQQGGAPWDLHVVPSKDGQPPPPAARMSNAYGAFATQPPPRQAFVVPPMPAPFDQIPPPRVEAAKEVFGSFAPEAQVPNSTHITHLSKAAAPAAAAPPAPARAAPVQPALSAGPSASEPKRDTPRHAGGMVLNAASADALVEAAANAIPATLTRTLKPGEAEAAAKAVQAQRNPLMAGGTTRNAPPLPQPARVSPYHVETNTAAYAAAAAAVRPNPATAVPAPLARPLTAKALRGVDTWKFACPSDATSNPDYRGPQMKDPYVNRWITDQETFREAREDQLELFDAAEQAVNQAVVASSRGGGGNEASHLLPVGTKLEVMPNGQLKVVVDPTATAVPPPQQQPPLTAQALVALAPKPSVNKQVEAKLQTALPFTSATLPLTSAVVQSVGGPAPTSIAKRTLDAIKREREATGKARWLLEAPARAEALQKQIDVIVTSLRKSVEAKGFAEPSKGAQFIAKVCRQQTSLPGDEMDFHGFCDALAKGFNQSLTDEQLEGLFDRLDVDDRTVIAFRDFGDHIFGIHTGTSSPVKRNKSMLAWVSNPKIRSLIEDIKTRIMRRHSGGTSESWLLSFSSAFRIMRGELGSSGEVDADMLSRSLTRMGVTCTLHECKDLVTALDTNRSGRVSEEEFLRAMRGPVPRGRRELVFRAFNILDVDKSGSVCLKEMADKYDVTKHPRVLSGEVKPEVILKEFIRLWNKDGDALVSWAEFLDYYCTISASIENDEYFELMIRNCWHMSGGTGAAANTTCRRVLVTFMDDTQKVCEIENDLGIGPRDMDKMKARLESQGIRNIKKIDLYG